MGNSLVTAATNNIITIIFTAGRPSQKRVWPFTAKDAA